MKKTYTMEMVRVHVDIVKRIATEETSQVFCQKLHDLCSAINFDINADSDLPPVKLDMFEGHPDPQAAFRGAVHLADTISNLIDLVVALACALAIKSCSIYPSLLCDVWAT